MTPSPMISNAANHRSSARRCQGLSPASVAHEQETARERPSASRGDRHARRARDLARAAFPPELHGRFVQEAVAVQAPAGELTALRVERQLAVERDAPAALDEGPAF